MSQYLEENLMSPQRSNEKPGRPSAGMFAIALSKDGRPVFGTKKTPLSTLTKLGWMAYDDEVERQRRLLAETALAQIVLEHPRYVQRTIDRVTQAILVYWNAKKLEMGTSLPQFSKVVTESEKYLYGATSFGRRDVAELPRKEEKDWRAFACVVDGWFGFLTGTERNIPQIMNLHDHFVRLFERVLKQSDEAQTLRFTAVKGTLRPKWYEDPALRGRINLDDHIKDLKSRTGTGRR